MPIADIKRNTEAKMDQTIAAFKNNLMKIRTGRANPALLDTVQVDYYGALVPVSQVANVSLLDARTISVQPWEKGLGAKIEKAIRDSDLGLNPSSMGDLIRVPMPAMSEERRKKRSRTSWLLRMTKSVPRLRFRRSQIDTSVSLISWLPLKSRTSWRSDRLGLDPCAFISCR